MRAGKGTGCEGDDITRRPEEAKVNLTVKMWGHHEAGANMAAEGRRRVGPRPGARERQSAAKMLICSGQEGTDERVTQEASRKS